MGPGRPRAVVLDAGALVAFERNDRRVRRLIELAAEHGRSLHGATGTADVVDASVALLARRHRAAVVTSDPDGLRRLDPELTLVAC